MKTKEVIRLLQEVDPSGEEECCIGNHDIFEISRWPAWYDGRLQVLERKPDCETYDIISGKFVADGVKIQIMPYGIDDALHDNPDMPVDCSFATDYENELVEKWRKQGREIHEKGKLGIS